MPSPHSKEISSKPESGVHMKTQEASRNLSHHNTYYSETGTNVESPSKESQESGTVPHPERNCCSSSHYQNHLCDPVTVKDKNKHTFRDRIGL
jgi:hypothetical protein